MTRRAAPSPSADPPGYWFRFLGRLPGRWSRWSRSRRTDAQPNARPDGPGIDRAALQRAELLALIGSWDLDLDGVLRDDTSLIKSGVVDSLALWNLVLWVEERLGRPVDPTSFDLIEEWDTVADILDFLDRHPVR